MPVGIWKPVQPDQLTGRYLKIDIFRAQDEGIGLESGQTGWFLEQRRDEPAFS